MKEKSENILFLNFCVRFNPFLVFCVEIEYSKMERLSVLYNFSWDFHVNPLFYMSVLIQFGFIINVLLIVLLTKNKKLRSNPSTFFIIAISICELLYTMQSACMILDVFPKTAGDNAIFANETVLFNLQVAFTVDRYFVICHPLSHHSRRDLGYQKWLIVICVVVTVFFSLLGRYSVKDELLLILSAVWAIGGILTMLILFGLMRTDISEMVIELTL